MLEANGLQTLILLQFNNTKKGFTKSKKDLYNILTVKEFEEFDNNLNLLVEKFGILLENKVKTN